MSEEPPQAYLLDIEVKVFRPEYSTTRVTRVPVSLLLRSHRTWVLSIQVVNAGGGMLLLDRHLPEQVIIISVYRERNEHDSSYLIDSCYLQLSEDGRVFVRMIENEEIHVQFDITIEDIDEVEEGTRTLPWL